MRRCVVFETKIEKMSDVTQKVTRFWYSFQVKISQVLLNKNGSVLLALFSKYIE
jgi:hypothetical protein